MRLVSDGEAFITSLAAICARDPWATIRPFSRMMKRSVMRNCIAGGASAIRVQWELKHTIEAAASEAARAEG